MAIQVGQAYEARSKGATARGRVGRHVLVVERVRVPEIGIRYRVKRFDNGELLEGWYKASELHPVTNSALKQWVQFR